ncbi:MAG: chemotaxis protein CheA [Bacteroidota bacterium]
MEQFKKKFLEEAADLINSLEKALLALEENPNDKSLTEEVFRIMHSLKGGSSMFGFNKMDAFTHNLETIYDLIRSGELSLNREILDLTLDAVDHLKVLLENGDELNAKDEKSHQILLSKINGIAEKSSISASQPNADTSAAEVTPAQSESASLDDASCYHITVKPNKDIFQNGTNPLLLIDELHTLGHCKAFAKTSAIPEFDKLNAEECYVAWEVFLSTQKTLDDINDVFIFVDDICDIRINKIADNNIINQKIFIDEVLNNISKDKFFDTDKLAEVARKIELNKENDKDASSSLEPEDTEEHVISLAKKTSINNIRVASGKLDDLMNLVSELITTQASLSLFAENNNNPELSGIAENIEKISRQLRDNTFEICLIPIDTIMIRFKRLVRDLSSSLNKEIQFIAEGTETELDKSIIEGLTEPIMHIFRNAIDHGIESTEERLKKGKPKQGKIILKAFYSGTNVYIQIQDDGRGIDAEKIREKAINRGFISPESNLSYKEILNLIFLPGFSTASKVTEVSGRGVGLDVVVKKIADIRGEVEIESQLGVGSTITIKLPLTMSIIDGLLVKIGKTFFVIPLSTVDKCFEIPTTQIENIFNNKLALDGNLIPFINLRNEFIIEGDAPNNQQVIRVSYDDFKIGLSVDRVIGEYQAVIKPLGKMYKEVEIVSGATILGDGTIALVLDTNKIINSFDRDTLNKRSG